MKIQRNIPLKMFTAFKVGGSADYFCRISSVDELKKAVIFARENNLPIFVLGDGSNILMSDSGFNGLVIKIELKGISYENKKEIITVTAGAGENWNKLVRESVKNKLYGIENLSFIPGTVGGAIAGNIGAYGMEIKDTAQWVEAFDTENLKTIVLPSVKCEFDYRESIFKKTEGKNYIVTRVCLKLSKKGSPNLSYKDLKEYFGKENKADPAIENVRKTIEKIRKRKFPDLETFGTAGSFFKNPILDGNKIHLAQILERIGLKGLKIGNVGLYENQPLVIVNYGGANAKEIKNFSDKIAREVYKKTKIKIIPEIIFVGEF